MNYPRLVAFTGHAGSGKDSAASTLIKLGYVRVCFAEALKDIVANLFNLERQLLEEAQYKTLPMQHLSGATPRHALQTIGQAAREVYPDVWVDKTRLKIEQLLAENQRVVVTDLRKPNEYAMLRTLKATVIAIERDSIDLSDPIYQHESEKYIKDLTACCDFVIKNDRSLIDLHLSVRTALYQTPVVSID